jgi:hypothetical protein
MSIRNFQPDYFTYRAMWRTILKAKESLIPVDRVTSDRITSYRIASMIHVIRDERVMLDSDLAELYKVETKVLLQSVKRNIDRFPIDFMFQLTIDEYKSLRSQIVTSKKRGGRRYPPYVFTEQGVAMLSSVLRSQRAVQVNIEIMRTFVKFRRMLVSHDKLAKKLDNLERKYDSQFKVIFDAIRKLMAPTESTQRRIGFRKSKK